MENDFNLIRLTASLLSVVLLFAGLAVVVALDSESLAESELSRNSFDLGITENDQRVSIYNRI